MTIKAIKALKTAQNNLAPSRGAAITYGDGELWDEYEQAIQALELQNRIKPQMDDIIKTLRCPNCESLERQNAELDLRLAEQDQAPFGFLTNKRQRITFEPNATGLSNMPMTIDWKIPLYGSPQPKEPEQKPKCNPHPKAPHGFNRNASHANDRYTCDCESWDAYDAGYQAGVMAGIEASMEQEPEQEPLATPLPCDVKVGHVTIRKGVALSVLVARMQVLYDMALAPQRKPSRSQTKGEEHMTKDDMIAMLRGVGCDENTITAMSNAYDLGFDYAKENMLALPVVELPLETK